MTVPSTPAARPSLGPGVPVLAFDVGGTAIKAAYLDPTGEAAEVLRVPSPAFGADSGERLIDLIATLTDQLLAEQRAAGRAAPVAIGMTLPGIVDDETGFATWAENLGWRDVDFAALAADRLPLPTRFGHDVRAAGVAEMELGAGQGYENAIVLPVGTGIAVSVFVHGRPVVARGYAGEIGHAVVVPGGEACVCGNQGCLEAIASAAAIARRYSRASGRQVAGAREVVEALAAGDQVATSIWDSATTALALALSHVVSLLMPEVIIVGGGLAQAGETLLGPIGEKLTAALRYVPSPPLVRATAGEDAGLLGAALLARRAVTP